MTEVCGDLYLCGTDCTIVADLYKSFVISKSIEKAASPSVSVWSIFDLAGFYNTCLSHLDRKHGIDHLYMGAPMLVWAVKHSYWYQPVKGLVKRGASLLTLYEGRTLCGLAYRHGHDQTLRMLIKFGADPSEIVNFSGNGACGQILTIYHDNKRKHQYTLFDLLWQKHEDEITAWFHFNKRLRVC